MDEFLLPPLPGGNQRLRRLAPIGNHRLVGEPSVRICVICGAARINFLPQKTTNSADSNNQQPMAISLWEDLITPRNNSATPGRGPFIPKDNFFTLKKNSFIPGNNSFTPGSGTFPPNNNSFIPQGKTFIPGSNSFTPKSNPFIPENKTPAPRKSFF
jgi:hypothetical protein